MVGGHPLPIIKNSFLLVELSAMQRGVQELRDTFRIDGIPLQEDSATGRILEPLTKAVEVTKRVLLQLEEGYTPSLPSTTAAGDEAALNLFWINAALKEYETALTTAADGRATIPSLLRRLVKKCMMQAISLPQTKPQKLWESAQDLLSEEADEARRRHHPVLLEEVESNWDHPN